MALEGHAAVEHGHGRAAAARARRRWRPATRPPACRSPNGPMKFHCAAQAAGSFGDELRRRAHVVRHRVGDVRLCGARRTVWRTGRRPRSELLGRPRSCSALVDRAVLVAAADDARRGDVARDRLGRGRASEPAGARRAARPGERRRVGIGLRCRSAVYEGSNNAQSAEVADGLRHGRHRVHRRARGNACGRGARTAARRPTATRRGSTGSATSRSSRSGPTCSTARRCGAPSGLRDRLPRRRLGGLAAARAGLAGQRAGAADRGRGGGGRGRAARGRHLERGRHRPGAGRPAGHRGGRLPRRRARPDLPGREARGRVRGARGGRAARAWRWWWSTRRTCSARRSTARQPGETSTRHDRQLPARAAAGGGGRARPTSSTCATWPRATCSPPSAGGPASATCWAATTSSWVELIERVARAVRRAPPADGAAAARSAARGRRGARLPAPVAAEGDRR